jgi:hypothetical protein
MLNIYLIVGHISFYIYRKFDTYGQLSEERDDFNLAIINFPHLYINIPITPKHGVFISQLILSLLASECEI